MSIVRWLHISDLHLNRIGTENTRLKEQLPEYLKKVAPKCDYVFCTGDIRYAPTGKFPEQVIDNIRSICEAVGASLSNFIAVPGNHDVDRDDTERIKAIRNIYFRQDNKVSGYYDPKDGVIRLEDLRSILLSEQGYMDALNEVFREQNCVYGDRREQFGAHQIYRTEKINIVAMDSTLVYEKEQQKELIVGTFDLMKALNARGKCKSVCIAR